MNKCTPSVYQRTSAAILLLCLFCMMANTCPVRSLLTGVSLPISYTEKSLNPHRLGDKSPRCSEARVSQALFLDHSKVNHKSYLSFSAFFSALGLCLALSVLRTAMTSANEKRKLFLACCIPLYLRNQSIII